MNDDLKASLAEFLGTFLLVFIGAGAGALSGADGGNIGLVGVALAHGIALLVGVYAFGAISGCHVNPAVTLSLLVTGHVGVGKAIFYWIAQFVGAAAAAFLLVYLLGNQVAGKGQTTGTLTDIDPVKTIVVEAVLTGFLVIAVFGSAVAGRNGNAIGLAIGLVLAMDMLMGGSLTGASMNPARTFGPALAAGNFTYFWMYVVGPCVGGVIAAVIYSQVLLSETKKA